ncbi:alkanesulfonate monooxygenase SsuD/methylene tetrahydromethanopterin reductase-like flavin-dependent oxidoreductase (luciferase family)/FAD/FMN-containing dehydrogenase [Nocardiopsis arvandica]|uniref:Alkanesulfonate monooxygenase SsuD/methylene tetrahydromethanopterin reductase-like flavin-dependent oxidoreductase (Luciferase family)/FAD/FMN-containing dehydrogenase n=1 Tax=Nocardiopsis sinuspersici TaxID=501010 RepID=A0A7Y9X7I3_9ACTN|nr:LLM class flavin-dependent oxidoreductase [Nocardiopsis sinuspersici]NYH50489.1 alkanesulfonate monooxygenase SsuD/methylene tetrahydromethanopterin reductase-like flavin-dependent oxidoreductase (luciferase family)/FAD/FMN-containing dehydrogenase [Nocardiopsis sinuspersici]
MSDYGHPLRFGTFVTPAAQDPDRAVTLAELTEAAGLDLATYQDHPYNPAFLDTWTLLSWVAARTTRLRVSANVLNLPLRPPAMLARSAATLDLLSHGRLELALGAGAFWDGIEAMGVERLTPRQAVDALSEGIDVIREVWDTDARGGVRVDGDHYTVRGMKRGPAPAHPIGISLGAYKPRMLRLVGAKADGWLPSLGYLRPEDMAASNRTIDEAALAAGRDPRQIRRMLNLAQSAFLPTGRGFLQGPPEQWVEDLLPLVLEHGYSTFLVATDDPRTVQTFGAEVAPALREAVARERADAGTVTGPARAAASLAARRSGIDYDAVPEDLRDHAVEPGDRAYAKVRHGYMQKGSPGLVLRPGSAEQVAEALAYGRAQEAGLHVRSGGHGISGRSTGDGGVVVDLARMDGVEVLDDGAGLVRLGAGARWGGVAKALAPYGMAISSGDHGGVGVGGLATTGGLGYMARAHGLTIDNVTAAEVVTADGRILRADADHHPDLFWGMRGAGANLGVLTAVEVTAAPVRDVVLGQFVYDATDTAAFLRAWGETAEAAPREVTAFLTMGPGRGGEGPVAQAMVVYAGEDTDLAVRALEPFLGVGPVLDQRAQLAPYPAVLVGADGPHQGHGLPESRSGLLRHITPEAAEGMGEMLASGDAMFMQLRQAGGAVNDVPAEATAYAHRSQNFSLGVMTGARRAAGLDTHWSALEKHLEGMYLSFDTRTGPEVLARAFPEPVLSRLRALKAQYDPHNVFDKNFPVTPARG